MIFGKRVGLWLSFKHYRPYSRHHNDLQQRIAHLVNLITQYPLPPTSHNWSSVTSLPTLDSAIAQLESLTGAATTSSLNAVHPPPTLLLVKLCSKVRSQADAENASHLIVTHLPSIPPNLRPPVLILVVHLLSTYRVLPALESVVRLFIGLPIFHEHWHFNRLLRALSHYTDSPTDGRRMARLAVLLLRTMTERELTLTKKTYRFLLQNRYITMELTEELRQRMTRENVVPDRAHLESFLRIFAHHPGSRLDDAATATCVHAIHSVDRRSKVPPPSFEETDRPNSQNPTVEYLSHLVDENAQRSQFDADAEWLRFVKTGLSLRFLNNKRNTTAAAGWAARLLSLSSTRSFSPENLVAFFEWSHAQRFPFRTHTTLSYTIVLRGLLRKRAYALALDVWKRYRNHGTRKLRLDLVAFGVGVEVLTRAGHPDRALALIDGAAKAKAPRDRRRPRMGARTTTPSPPPSLVTCFMRVLGATNPSAALRLWDHMGTLYDATPDAHAFTAMLNAARHATLNGESFAGAMQELGFSGFPFRFRSPSSASALGIGTKETDRESLYGARRRIYADLRKSLAVDEGDMWGDERAWRRAHRIFAEALLAGWPQLADVRPPPARAVRATSDGPATSPLRDLKRFLAPPSTQHQHHNHDPPNEPDFTLSHLPPPPPLLPIHPRGAYPSFAPDDATFRASVLLLGTAGAATKIPLVLAWMRALGLAPRARTLAYALVFWAEVSIGAPLLERWRGGVGGEGWSGGGEYLRFVRWLEEWVGVGNVPDEAEVGEAMRRVDAMRRGRSSSRSAGRAR